MSAADTPPEAPHSTPRSTRRWWVLAVILLGLFTRLWAMWQLPVDADEPVYLQAASDYTRLIRAGDWAGVLNYPVNSEHPPLVKLVYALPAVVGGRAVDPTLFFLLARFSSVLFGTLSVALLALIHPAAGALLAIQTLAVKYTSEAYLEALPQLGAVLAVWALVRSQRRGQPDRWLWVSAVGLGLAGAGKYSYAPVIVPVLWLLLGGERGGRRVVGRQLAAWRHLAAYGVVAGLTFLALNPAVWPDPLGRLSGALLFHQNYSQGVDVIRAAYPWYQPLAWIAQPVPWHPEAYLYLPIDTLIFLAALPGLYLAWRGDPANPAQPTRRWAVVWLLAGLAVLLIWPTKWPQYTLLILPPLCVLAGETLVWLWRRLMSLEEYYGWIGSMLERPSRGHLVIGVLFVAVLVGGRLFFEVDLALARRGWTYMNTENTTNLPADTVYDLLLDRQGRMWAATERGVGVWTAPPEDAVAGTWQAFTPVNSPLPAGRVLALAEDERGTVWLGTQNGLAGWDGQDWTVFRADDFGLAGEQVNAVQPLAGGELWIGTDAGLAHWDGSVWRGYATGQNGLAGDSAGLSTGSVFALTVDRDGRLWAAVQSELCWLEPGAAEWVCRTPVEGGAALVSLLVDGQGRLWVGSLGGGVLVANVADVAGVARGEWDASVWQIYRTSNSEIPHNAVLAALVPAADEVWLATAHPTEAGGVLARWRGDQWQRFQANNSGYSGAEPLALAVDGQGRLWIGTRTAGIYVYDRPDAADESE